MMRIFKTVRSIVSFNELILYLAKVEQARQKFLSKILLSLVKHHQPCLGDINSDSAALASLLDGEAASESAVLKAPVLPSIEWEGEVISLMKDDEYPELQFYLNVQYHRLYMHWYSTLLSFV